MTTELAARLRELAEKATRGPWRADTEGKPDDDMNHGIVADVNDLWIAACYRSGTTADCERSSEAESEVAANAAYIAATNPQTILALLDEIDSLRATIQSFEDGSEKMALKGIKMRREIDRLRQRKDELQRDLQTTADALGHADKEIETLRAAEAPVPSERVYQIRNISRGGNPGWHDCNEAKFRGLSNDPRYETRALLPRETSAQPVEQVLKADECQIDTWPAYRSGMQVGMSRGVIITHTPSQIAVACNSERSQHQNRDKAEQLLRSVLATSPQGSESK